VSSDTHSLNDVAALVVRKALHEPCKHGVPHIWSQATISEQCLAMFLAEVILQAVIGERTALLELVNNEFSRTALLARPGVTPEAGAFAQKVADSVIAAIRGRGGVP